MMTTALDIYKELRIDPLTAFTRIVFVVLLSLTMSTLHAADFSIYIDSDLDPVTGCGNQGIEVLIEASTSPAPQYIVDSLQVSTCVNGVMGPPVAAPAGFTIGLDNGIAGSDVVEIAVALNLLGLDGTEVINAGVVLTAPGSTDTVIPLPGLDLVTGELIPEPPVKIPSLTTMGLVLLTALLALAGLYYLPGNVRGVAVLLVFVSGVLLAQTVRFVADGQVGDWAGRSPAAASPGGSGSPLSEVRQLFFATQGPELFVRMDITEIEAPDLFNANPYFGATAGGYTVELSVSGFLSTGTSVSVDGADCTALAVIDPSRLTCTMPAHAAGPADIVVATPAGQSAPIPFNYEDPKLTTLITGTGQAISFHTVQLTGYVATVTTATPTFQWTQIFGEPVNLVGANTPDLRFEAPGVNIGQSLEFRLDTSADGLTGHTTHVVTISPETVGVDAGPDVSTLTGADVSFHAVGHSDGGALTWAWTQLEGDSVTINGADTPNATFTAPATAGTLKFEVRVTDPANVQASDIVEVTVSPKPAPILTPASVIATTSGSTVTMQVHVNGGTTLPPGASISWTQLSGPAVTLQGGNGLTPSFIAPAVQQPTIIEFRSTMTTTTGTGSITHLLTKVHPAPDTTPIHVDAGKDQRAEGGDTIQLHVDVLSGVTSPVYEWKQIPVPGGLPAGLTGSRQATLVNTNAQTVTVQLPAIPDTPDSLGNRLAFQVTVSQGLRVGTDIVEVDLRKLLVNAQVADQVLLGRGNAFPGEIVHLTSRPLNAKAPVDVLWVQTAGPAQSTLTGDDLPDASALLPVAGDYTFEVDVTDALGNTAKDTVTVSAVDRAPPPKVVIPPVSQLTASATGGSTQTHNQTFEADTGIMAEVFFAGDITPPTVTWAQTNGPLTNFTPSPDGKTIVFDAPLVDADTRLTFEVTVDDTANVVTVPVDYLILDRTIGLSIDNVPDSYVGKSTSLRGRASGGGGALAYQWDQVGNGAPAVTLQDATTSVAHFTAAAPGTYVFDLTVSDSLNNLAIERVTAHVDSVPAVPGPATVPVEILFPPPVNFVEGNTSRYDAVINNRPVGAQVSWTEVLGNVALVPVPDPSDPSIVELALPAVTSDQPIQLKVAVTDIGGTLVKEATSPVMVIQDRVISVSAQRNGSGAIYPKDTVHLAATVSPAAFGTVQYQWVLKSGTGALSGAATANPDFVPDTNETAVLEVTATDSLGNTANATVSVVVAPPLTFTAPVDVSHDWPADADKSAVPLHLAPTGGSGQFRFDFVLEVYDFNYKEWDTNIPGSTLGLDFDDSNPGNPIVKLTAKYFDGSGNSYCLGVPCDTVRARLQVTVTDTLTGETKSGTTEIEWREPKITQAQKVLASTPPSGAESSCASDQADRLAAWKAAKDAGEPIGQYVCSGPPKICERLFHGTTSKDPATPYGILHLVNHDTGARDMTREFGNYDRALHEWYQGTSDNDRCTNIDLSFVQTLDFECTFAYIAVWANNARAQVCPAPAGGPDGNSPKKQELFKEKTGAF
jgi:hypothetical protein